MKDTELELFTEDLKGIINEADRMTSGNYMHHIASIKAICQSTLNYFLDLRYGREEKH